jgi:hypothetical protein
MHENWSNVLIIILHVEVVVIKLYDNRDRS